MRPGYLAAALAILVIEILIALFVTDRIVRPHLGDTLAVILVYAGLRGVTPLRILPAAAIALAVAVAVELGQLLGLIHALGLGDNRVARVVLGTGFDPMDFVFYAAGALGALAVEKLRGADFSRS